MWNTPSLPCLVVWGCRIYPTASLQMGKPPPPNECTDNDTKQSDGDDPVSLELNCHHSSVHSGLD